MSWRKTLRNGLRDHQWSIVGAFAVVALVLGIVGFWRRAVLVGEASSPLDVFYLTVQLFTLESGAISKPLPWELDVARFLAPAVAAYAVAKAVAILFHERLQWFRVRFMKGHVVICGLGRKGLLLATAFRDKGFKVVVIDQDKENSRLDQCGEDGAIVLVGNAMDRVVLRKAGVGRARHLVAVCGADGRNVEIAMQARELWTQRPASPIDVHVHISDAQLRQMLTEKSLTTQPGVTFRIQYFNTFENGARALLEMFPLPKPKELVNGITKIVVVGLGQLGENFVVQAARNWSELYRDVGHRLHVLVVDKAACGQSELLLSRNPDVGKLCNIVPLEIDTSSPKFHRAEFLQEPDGTWRVAKVYICLDDDLVGLSAGLALVRKVREHGVPVVVRLAMIKESGLTSLLRLAEGDSKDAHDLHVFGLLDNTCTLKFVDWATNEVLARASHVNYLHMLEKAGAAPQTHPAMVKWEDLDEGYRESNRQQAADMGLGLRKLGYYVVPQTTWNSALFKFPKTDVEVLAEREHKRWSDERQAAGWTWGEPRSDPDKKHPNLVPWIELSEEVKEIDRNVVRTFPAALAEVGFEVVRGRPAGPSLREERVVIG